MTLTKVPCAFSKYDVRLKQVLRGIFHTFPSRAVVLVLVVSQVATIPPARHTSLFRFTTRCVAVLHHHTQTLQQGLRGGGCCCCWRGDGGCGSGCFYHATTHQKLSLARKHRYNDFSQVLVVSFKKKQWWSSKLGWFFFVTHRILIIQISQWNQLKLSTNYQPQKGTQPGTRGGTLPPSPSEEPQGLATRRSLRAPPPCEFHPSMEGFGEWRTYKKNWKLTWHWKIPIFNRKYIFKWWIFHCHVSSWGGNTNMCNTYGTCMLHSRAINFFRIIPLVQECSTFW